MSSLIDTLNQGYNQEGWSWIKHIQLTDKLQR
jgi:hypothetical protein